MASITVQVREPMVVHETVDGEVLVVHLASGAYYSGTGLTALVWNAMAEGHPLDALAEQLAAEHEVDAATARADLDTFVADLVEQSLVAEGAPPVAPDPLEAGRLAADAYVAPRLDRFDDLADLIQLDPVHDVTDAGWPNAAGGPVHP